MDLSMYTFDDSTRKKISGVMETLNRQYAKIQHIVQLNPKNRHSVNKLFTCFPYYFANEFPNVSDADMAILCQCSAYCMENIMLYDEILDTAFEWKESDINSLFEKLLFNQTQAKLLSQLFEKNSPFWNYYESYYHNYIAAVKQERQHCKTLCDYDYEEFQKTTRGLYSLWKWPIAALGLLSGNETKINQYEEILDLHAEASQLFDDIKDWKDDFKAQRFTWLLSSMIKEHNLSVEADIREISSVLFGHDYDQLILEKVSNLCEEITLKAGNAEPYIKLIRCFQGQVDSLNRDFHAMKGETSLIHHRKNKAVINFVKNHGLKDFIQKRLDCLTHQKANEYPELVHWIFINPDSGFPGAAGAYKSELFQRFFLLNIYQDLSGKGFKIKDDCIERELEYLLDENGTVKHRSDYLPGFHPDIDLIGEVLNFLSFYPYKKLEFFVERNVKRVFHGSQDATGLFEKWIPDDGADIEGFKYSLIENDNATLSVSESNRKKLIQAFFSSADDPSSNAAFILGLLAYNRSAYYDRVKKQIIRLVNTQNSDGSFTSSWYGNSYYCCYLMARLFNRVPDYEKHAARLSEFIDKSKNKNGSWGDGKVMNTAFALLTIIELRRFFTLQNMLESVNTAVEYVLNTMTGNDCWKSEEFYELYVAPKYTNAFYRRSNVYKSSLFTTAVCMKALAAAHEYLINPSLHYQKDFSLSKYNVYVPLDDQDKYFLLHGYTGAMDVISGDIYKELQQLNGTTERKTCLFEQEISHLINRGYVTIKTSEEEHELFNKTTALLMRKFDNAKVNITLIPTYNCNFKCDYCFEGHLYTNNQSLFTSVITESKVDEIIAAMVAMEKKGMNFNETITLLGGEPLMRENKDIIEYIVDKFAFHGYVFSAITNGYDLDSYNHLLRNDGIQMLQITLDGKQDVHDRRRILKTGDGTFNKIVSNISQCLKTGMRINLRSNIDKRNLSDIHALIDFYKSQGWTKYENFVYYFKNVDSCSLKANESVFESQIKNAISNNPNISDAFDYMPSYLQMKYEFTMFLKNKRIPLHKPIYCGAAINLLTIDLFGFIYPCLEMIGKKDKHIGRLEQGTFVFNDLMKFWRERTVTALKKCSTCAYALFCGGSCPAHSEAITGNIYNSRCEDFKSIFRDVVRKTYKEMALTQ